MGPLGALPEVLRQHGAAPVEVLRSLGLPANSFENDDKRMALRDVGRLLQDCTDRTGVGHFALLVGREFDLTRMGLLGYLVKNQPTVEAALRELVLHLHLQDRGATMELETLGARARISYGVTTPGVPATGLIHSFVAMLGCRVLQELCGPQWHPEEVQIAQRSPANAAPYRTLFECPVHFEAPRTTVVFDAGWLPRSVQGADPRLLAALRDVIARLEAAMHIGCADRVRRVLRNKVMAGSVSAAAVARTLRISPRTLRRRLAAEGIGFHELLAEVRIQVAQQLLEHTAMPVTGIAGALHYSDSSAFSRAFFRWTATTPSAWRATQLRARTSRRPAAGRAAGR